MAGLDKIIGEINAESRQTIDEVQSKASREAQQIMTEAEKKANESCEKLAHDREIRLSDQLSRATSAAALTKRQMLLAEKQRLISEVLSQAKQDLIQLPENEYFPLLLALISKNALPQNGEIIFSEKDLRRLPSDFAASANKAASEKGGSLKVSDSTRLIDGGFILAYDGIEENCSISALFETNIEELQDQIQRLLFMP